MATVHLLMSQCWEEQHIIVSVDTKEGGINRARRVYKTDCRKVLQLDQSYFE